MKQQANKSFFGLKWLAVLIATLFLFVGTFAHVSTVNAETELKDITKMTIQGAYQEKINFVDGEDYNATVTIKLTYNKPQLSEVKVPIQIKNLPSGKGGIRLSVYRDKDNSLILIAFVETAIDHNVLDYQQIPIEDGKVTKAFQYTATAEDRAKFVEDLSKASEEEEKATTVAKNENSTQKSSDSNSSNSKSSNTNSLNAKPSTDKDIFDQIDNFFDQLDTDKIAEGIGKGGFYIILIIAVFFAIRGKQKQARKNTRRARTGNTRSAQRTGANATVQRAQGTSTPVVATEAVPQRVYRPRNNVSNPKIRSQAKKQVTKQALQSTSSRSSASRETYVGTPATSRTVMYKTARKEKSHTLPRVLSSRTLPRVLKTPRLK
mgnify:FL=1